jgi:rhodanese-related sulfurtransferase
MTTLTRDQVKAHVDQNSAVIIESLPEAHYAAGHLPGAIRLMADQVKDLAPQLLKDKDRQIITYCASQKCTASADTAEVLKGLGYKNVAKYAGGKEDWSQAGLSLEKSAGSCGSADGAMKEGSCGTKTGTCG